MIELKPELVPVLKVPSEYFANPGDLVKEDTKLTLDLDADSPTYGRVFGLVAPFGRCLLDGGKDCWSVDDLKRDDPHLDTVHQGDAIDTNDGMVKVASLAGNGGHADVHWGAAQAKAFMDNPDTQVARVRYHWHPLGLVASGVANRSMIADEEATARFLASPSSLDARWMTQVRYLKDEGRYALTGAVMVVSPGFPLTRAASASDLMTGESFFVVDGAAHVAAVAFDEADRIKLVTAGDAAIDGEKINLADFKIGRKKPFKGLGIKREDMPQLEDDQVSELLDALKADDIDVSEPTFVSADTLEASQSELSAKKAREISLEPKINELLARPIVVSSDGYVLDGHHRFVAAIMVDKEISVIRVGERIKALLKRAEDFSGKKKSFTAAVAEDNPVSVDKAARREQFMAERETAWNEYTSKVEALRQTRDDALAAIAKDDPQRDVKTERIRADFSDAKSLAREDRSNAVKKSREAYKEATKPPKKDKAKKKTDKPADKPAGGVDGKSITSDIRTERKAIYESYAQQLAATPRGERSAVYAARSQELAALRAKAKSLRESKTKTSAQEAAMEMTTGNAAPAASTFAEGDEAMLDGEMVEIVQLVTTPDGVEMAVLDNDVVVPVASLKPVGNTDTAPVPPAAVASAKPCACTKTAADMAHGDVPVALPEQDNPDVKGMLGAMQESIMAILDLVQRIDSNGRTAAARLIPELADFDAMAARLAMSYVVTDAPAIASYGEVRLSDGTLAVATYALGSTADGVRMYEVKRISEDGTFEEVGTLYAEGDLEATGKQYDYRHNSDADVVITDATGEVVPA